MSLYFFLCCAALGARAVHIFIVIRKLCAAARRAEPIKTRNETPRLLLVGRVDSTGVLSKVVDDFLCGFSVISPVTDMASRRRQSGSAVSVIAAGPFP